MPKKNRSNEYGGSMPSTKECCDPGLYEAMSRNPNYDKHGVNDSPDGPHASGLGLYNTGGMQGDTEVKGKHGASYYFR